MEIILLVAHGSPSKLTGDMEKMAVRLHKMIHPECIGECVQVAYLQFIEPDIMQGIERAVKDGAERVIIHPCFLSHGVHVNKSIPKIIRQAEEAFPEVEFIYTEPLGPHDKLAEIILERVESAKKKAK